MAKGVFYHKPDSDYDDRPEEFYHFPGSYLSRVQQTEGDFVLFYGPLPKRNGRFYWATARVLNVRPDPVHRDKPHFYADMDDYVDLEPPVPYLQNGGFEKKLVNTDGSINSGRAVQAVRIIEDSEYEAIVGSSWSSANDWPERYDDTEDNSISPSGFDEGLQTPFERPIISQLLNRKFRDYRFRQNVRAAYDRTCAFTGLRLINGQGRPEVEAAHIVPVEANGRDLVNNGIALSGTVHWMFDRGLLSLTDDFTILRSRHLNHDVSHLLHHDQKARGPVDPRLRPHPHYLNWHRVNRFKQ